MIPMVNADIRRPARRRRLPSAAPRSVVPPNVGRSVRSDRCRAIGAGRSAAVWPGRVARFPIEGSRWRRRVTLFRPRHGARRHLAGGEPPAAGSGEPRAARAPGADRERTANEYAAALARVELLDSLSVHLGRSPDPETLARRLVERVTERFGDVAVWLHDDRGLRRVAGPLSGVAAAEVASAFRTGDLQMTAEPAGRTVVALPLLADGAVLGVLAIAGDGELGTDDASVAAGRRRPGRTGADGRRPPPARTRGRRRLPRPGGPIGPLRARDRRRRPPPPGPPARRGDVVRRGRAGRRLPLLRARPGARRRPGRGRADDPGASGDAGVRRRLPVASRRPQRGRPPLRRRARGADGHDGGGDRRPGERRGLAGQCRPRRAAARHRVGFGDPTRRSPVGAARAGRPRRRRRPARTARAPPRAAAGRRRPAARRRVAGRRPGRRAAAGHRRRRPGRSRPRPVGGRTGDGHGGPPDRRAAGRHRRPGRPLRRAAPVRPSGPRRPRVGVGPGGRGGTAAPAATAGVERAGGPPVGGRPPGRPVDRAGRHRDAADVGAGD